MDKFDRIQQLHRILSSHRYPVSISRLATLLECTNRTAKTAIDNLRDQLNAPLIYDEAKRGWLYDKQADKFELPGLWLTADELNSLSSILHILNTMDEGLLGDEIKPLQQQVEKLLKAKGINASAFKKTVKYLSITKRAVTSKHFAIIIDGLIHRKQLSIHYTDYAGRKTQRTISPQQLVHYQENWYLDAWCHKREALRSFMLPRINKVFKENARTKVIEKSQLEEHYQSSYGIFAGKPKNNAELLFYPPAAAEAASIKWHPQQQAQWQEHCYHVTIPYNDDRELIRDILKYGNNVEVLKPAALKNKIKNIALGIVEIYTGKRVRL